MKTEIENRSAAKSASHFTQAGTGGWCAAKLALFFSLLLVCLARAQNASIDWFTIDAGGGVSASGNSSISGTIGQPDTGAMSGGTASLEGGFWLAAEPAATLLALNSSANPALPGANVTFTAVVTGDADLESLRGKVQFTIDGSPFGTPLDLTSGEASVATASLSHGLHSITAEYFGDANFMGASNNLDPDQVVNTPPLAANQTLGASQNKPSNLPGTKLLARASDPDGDALVITNVSNSLQGGTVLLNGNTVTYTPPLNHVGADSFTYTVADAFGGTAIGVINVTVTSTNAQSRSIVSITPRPDGNMEITFAGLPGQNYLVQATPDLILPTWTTIGTNTAGGNGLFLFIDLDATNYVSRFYRNTLP